MLSPDLVGGQPLCPHEGVCAALGNELERQGAVIFGGLHLTSRLLRKLAATWAPIAIAPDMRCAHAMAAASTPKLQLGHPLRCKSDIFLRHYMLAVYVTMDGGVFELWWVSEVVIGPQGFINIRRRS